jgi:hypothetical protein
MTGAGRVLPAARFMVWPVALDAENVRQSPLFAVDGDVYSWNDVVNLARLRGDWDALAEEARAGLAAIRELEQQGAAPEPGEVDAAQREFRYARGLLSGDELDAWLDRRGLTSAEWRAYFERQVALESVPDPASTSEIDQTEVEACLWPEGICSGWLEQLATTLARKVAVAPGVSLDGLDDAFEAFCRDGATDDQIAREVDVNQLEWLRVVYDAVDFESEDAAREAALCIRDDGDSIADVASRAGESVERHEEWLEEVARELASQFLAARPGDLIGPVPLPDGFQLALLLEKAAALPEDEDVRARARAVLAERAAAREANERVVWIERL